MTTSATENGQDDETPCPQLPASLRYSKLRGRDQTVPLVFTDAQAESLARAYVFIATLARTVNAGGELG
jgi:hypothetical protein